MNRSNPFFYIVFILFTIFCFSNCKRDQPDKTKQDETTIQKALSVRSRILSDPDRLNPMLTVNATAIQVVNLLFPRLLDFDPNTYELSPMLAKSRPKMDLITEGKYKGGAAYTFDINEKAVWDNGKPVLATDYLFTMKALFNPEVQAAPYRGALSALKEVKLDPNDPRRFTVYTDQIFRAESTMGFYVYPEHVYDSTGVMQQFELGDLLDPDKLSNLKKDPNLIAFAKKFNNMGLPDSKVESCGPYKLVSWRTGQQIILEKKKDWWGDELVAEYPLLSAYPKEIVFKIIPDNVAAITAMKDGQLDVLGKVATASFKEFQESSLADQYQFYSPEELKVTHMGFNMRRSHLEDKKVRRAIAHLTDVEEIIASVYLGLARPAVGPFPTYAPYFKASLSLVKFNVEKAKTMLKEAGWEDTDQDAIVDKMIAGKRVQMTIEVLSWSHEINRSIVSIIKEDARKAGVNIVLTELPVSKLFERLRARDFDAFFLASGFDLDFYPPAQYWHTKSDTPSGSNRVGFGNSQTDAIIDEIAATSNEERRKALYFELQDIIYEEQPFVFLYTPKARIVSSKKIKKIQTALQNPGYLENYFQ